jgi:hypothetical protein
MGRSSLLVAFPVLALITAASSFLSAQNKPLTFSPPDIATAGDMNYPVDSVASGVVVVAVGLDGAGSIKKTDVLRDIPSLTSPVLLAIQTWTFKPATLDGKGVDSTIIVNIVFNPKDYRLGGTAAPVLGKELEVPSRDASGFLPPKIMAASWAEYPLESVEQGAVILDASVSPTGQVTQVIPIWRSQSLTDASIDAAKTWTFRPAKFGGAPTVANTVVGYVFRLSNLPNHSPRR